MNNLFPTPTCGKFIYLCSDSTYKYFRDEEAALSTVMHIFYSTKKTRRLVILIILAWDLYFTFDLTCSSLFYRVPAKIPTFWNQNSRAEANLLDVERQHRVFMSSQSWRPNRLVVPLVFVPKSRKLFCGHPVVLVDVTACLQNLTIFRSSPLFSSTRAVFYRIVKNIRVWE